MLEFVVVAEAEADARLVCDLADRIFLEEGPDWIYDELLPNLRGWSGFDDPTYTRWPAIKAAMREHHARPHYLGYVQGKPQRTACAESRKAILLAIERQKRRRIDGLILAKDIDSQPDASRTSRPDRDPKRILSDLTNQNSEREERCWKETPLAILQSRGRQTYLEEFLAEIRERLLHLLMN